jgi:hypothetical protein
MRNERTQKRHEDSGWRLDSSGASDLEPEAHVDLLIDELWRARDYLQTLASTCEMQFSIVIHCHETAPPIHLTRAALHRITSLQAAIDIDLYCRQRAETQKSQP